MTRIDGHTHNMIVGGEARFLRFLDSLDMRMNNVRVAYTPEKIDPVSPYRELHLKYPAYCTWTTTFEPPNWSNIPGWTAAVCEQLSRDADDGACGVKVWRTIGMLLKKPDGSYEMCDDPVLDPIYECGPKLDLTLLIHIGEPAARWPEGQKASIPMLYTVPRTFGPFANDEYIAKTNDFPSYWAQIAARDRIMEQHPGLRVVGAHFGSIEHNMNELAARFKKYPNFSVDTSGRRGDAAMHDRAIMLKTLNDFPDRFIWGMDQGTPTLTDSPDDTAWKKWEKMMSDGYLFEQQTYESNDSHTYTGINLTGMGLSKKFLADFYVGNFKKWYPRAFVA